MLQRCTPHSMLIDWGCPGHQLNEETLGTTSKLLTGDTLGMLPQMVLAQTITDYYARLAHLHRALHYIPQASLRLSTSRFRTTVEE